MSECPGKDSDLSQRVQDVRQQLFGECGGPVLAELLGIPQRRLARFEAGGPIPGELILKLIDITGVNPRWLLSGEGERYGMPAHGHIGRRDPGSRLG